MIALLFPLLSTLWGVTANSPGDAYDHINNRFVPDSQVWMEFGVSKVSNHSWSIVETSYMDFLDPVVFLSIPPTEDRKSISLRVNNTKLTYMSAGEKLYTFEVKSFGINDKYCTNVTYYDPFPMELIIPSLDIVWMVIERGMFNISNHALIINSDSINRTNNVPGDKRNEFKSFSPNKICNFGTNCRLNRASATIAQIQTTRFERFLSLRFLNSGRRFVVYSLIPHDSSQSSNYYIPNPGEIYAWILFETGLGTSCVENVAIESRSLTISEIVVELNFQNFQQPPGIFGTVSLFGRDSTTLRVYNIDPEEASVITQEDRCLDSENEHEVEENLALIIVGESTFGGSVRCGIGTGIVPTSSPSVAPTADPTASPTTAEPTASPTVIPTTLMPTCDPTGQPSGEPSAQPSSGAVILESSLSSDGLTVQVWFNVNVELDPLLKSIFPCDEIVSFTLAQFSLCSWSSSKLLKAQLYANTARFYNGSISSHSIGSVHAQPQRIRACIDMDCLLVSYVEASRSVPIGIPDAPITPVASLSVSSNYVSCAGITIDPSSSTGAGGLSWVNIKWEVNGTGDVTGLNMALDSNYSSDILSEIFLPSELLNAAGNFSIRLILTNFFGLTSSAVVDLYADDGRLRPSVSIHGGNSILYFRDTPLNLLTQTVVPPCLDVGLPLLRYDWTVKTAENYANFLEVSSISNDPRRFRLPAFTLNSSTVYIVEVVGYVDDERVVPSSYSVAVTVEPLYGTKALIRGGTLRTVSALEPWELDASRSFHLDDPGASLEYHWSCIETTSLPGAPCSFDLENASVLVFPALGSVSTKRYVFSVAVSSLLDDGISVTEVTVIVSPAAVPMISMGPVADKVDPLSYVLLNCSINTPYAIDAAWSSIDVDNHYLATISHASIKRSFSAGYHIFTLKVAENRLVAGQSYAFRVDTYPSNANYSLSRAEVIVTANIPPYRGILDVYPSEGYAVNTTFSFKTNSWLADVSNFPLLYRISYYVNEPSARFGILSLGSVYTATALLSEGDPNSNYSLTCIAVAVDIYGSSGETTQDAHVYPTKASYSSLFAAANSNMENAINSTDYDRVDQLTAGFARILLRQDCNAAPNCSSLHRNPCSIYPQTCGECLHGYVGLATPSNEACVPVASSNVSGITNGSCSEDAECLSFRCDNGTCVSDVLATCPGSCSNRGECIALDSNGGSVPQCSLFNPYCMVQCKCDPGFYGQYCNFHEEDIKIIEEWQLLLCREFELFVNTSDPSDEAILSRAVVLSLLLHDVTILNPEAMMMCGRIVINSIVGEPYLSGSYIPFHFWIHVLSQAISAPFVSSDPGASADVLRALLALSLGAQDHLVAGESISLSESHIRISSIVSYPKDDEDDSGEFFEVPRTKNEQASGAILGSVSVREYGPDDSTEIGYVLFVFVNNPLGGFGNSTQIEFESIYYADDDDNRRRRLQDATAQSRTVTVVIPNVNNVPIETPTTTDEVVVECFFNTVDGLVQSYYEDVDCGDVIHSVNCWGNDTYTILVDCLASYSRPQCVLWGNEEPDIENCTLLDYTELSTTCSCAESFRVVSLVDVSPENTVRVNYGVTASLVGESFISRFGAVTSLSASALERNIVIFSIMLTMVLIIIIGGFILLMNDFVYIDYASIRLKYVDSNYLRVRNFKELIKNSLPIYFSSLPWQNRYKALLFQEHEWLALLSSDRSDYSRRNNFISLLWVGAFGKMINFFFIGTVLVLIYFPDDDTCESFSSRSSCLEPVAIDLQSPLCEWDSRTKSCDFSEKDSLFASVIGVAVAINILVSPIDAMLRFFLRMTGFLLQSRENQMLATLEGRKARCISSYKNGELSMMQTPKSKMLCAARLVHMKNNIDDHVTAFGEVDNFVRSHAARRAQLMTSLESSVPITDTSVSAGQSSIQAITKWHLLVKESMYDAPAHIINKKLWEDDLNESNLYWLLHSIRRARSMSKSAVDMMKQLPDDDSRDEYLIRLFIVEGMVGYRRQLASMYFLDRSKFGYQGALFSSTYFQWACTIFIPVYLIFFCFYIFTFGVSIGPSSTYLWLVSILFAYLQNIILIEPVLIYVYGIAMAGLVYKDVTSLASRIKSHGKTILTRTRGTTFCPSTHYLHHLNTACRVARVTPRLDVSRLLISFNDWDLPVSFIPRYHQSGILSSCIRFLLLLQAALAMIFLYILPSAFQEAIIEVVLSLAVGFIFMAFYISDDSGAAALGVAFAILLTIFILMVAVYSCFRKKRKDWRYVFNEKEHDARIESNSTREPGHIVETAKVRFREGDVSSIYEIPAFDSPGNVGSGNSSPEILNSDCSFEEIAVPESTVIGEKRREMSIQLLNACIEDSP